MEVEWERVRSTISLANSVATASSGPALQAALRRAVWTSVERCRAERKRKRATQTERDLSDEAIARAAKWTDALPLHDYDGILHLVPRLVNVVTVRKRRTRTL